MENDEGKVIPGENQNDKEAGRLAELLAIPEDERTTENFAELAKIAQTAVHQKAHWRKKAEGNGEGAGESANNKPAEPSITDIEKRLERKLELKSQGYTDEDIAFINANGGDVNNPYVKNALESAREQRAAEKASEVHSSGQSDVEKKYSPEELRRMSTEDLEKILPRA